MEEEENNQEEYTQPKCCECESYLLRFVDLEFDEQFFTINLSCIVCGLNQMINLQKNITVNLDMPKPTKKK